MNLKALIETFFIWLSPKDNNKKGSFISNPLLDSQFFVCKKGEQQIHFNAIQISLWGLQWIHWKKRFLIRRPSSSFVKHVFNYPLVKLKYDAHESCPNRIHRVETFSQFFLTALPKSVGEEEFIGMQYSNLANEICISICRGPEDLIDRRKLLQEFFLASISFPLIVRLNAKCH